MATFKNMRDDILRKVKGRDQAGTLRDAINQAINDAYATIMAESDWVWARRCYRFLTVAPLTESDGSTLTVSGAGNVTLTSDDATDLEALGVNSYWQVVDDVRRPVSSVSEEVITLGVGWPDTTNITSYKLYPMQYAMTSGVGRIVEASIQDGLDRYKLKELYADEFMERYRDTLETGRPERFAVTGFTDAGLALLSFDKLPDEPYMVEIWYYAVATTLSSDSHTPILPARWHRAIVVGALWDLYENVFKDLRTAAKHERTYDRLLFEMLNENSATTRESVELNPYRPDPFRRCDREDSLT